MGNIIWQSTSTEKNLEEIFDRLNKISIATEEIKKGNLNEKAANEITKYIIELTNRAKTFNRPCNILVIGSQHHGKSRFINTVVRVLKTLNFIIHENPAPAGNFSVTKITKNLQRIELIENKLYLYDTPGKKYKNEEEWTILENIFNGLKDETVLDDDSIPNSQIILNLKKCVEPKNKIDEIIFVLNPTVLKPVVEFDPSEYTFYSRFFNYLVKLNSGRYPYIVFTCKDKSDNSCEIIYKSFCTAINPETQNFFIQNYLSNMEAQILETDKLMYSLFAQIVTSLKSRVAIQEQTLAEFLQSLELGKLIDKFTKQEIFTVKDLMNLTVSDFKELDITIGSKNRILEKLGKL